ncbi:hypothetical protein [Falsibacillus pallidus]|nr:hypothetical protein [Falsibacillus pallidus]
MYRTIFFLFFVVVFIMAFVLTNMRDSFYTML